MNAADSLAGLMRRLVAYLFDCVLLFTLVLASQAALFALGAHPFMKSLQAAPIPASTAKLHLWVFASTTLPFLAYFSMSFRSARGATVGQRLAGLRVVGKASNRLKAGASLTRALVLLVPFELNHAAMFHLHGPNVAPGLAEAATGAVILICLVYLALPLLRRDRRSLHDMAAASFVERV
jgi:uncharacterized RDD family membrane protein YckC